MQIRCYKCQTPFPITREAAEAALNQVTQEGYKHYDMNCPKCGRVNRVSKQQLHRAAPTWKQAPKQG